MGSSQHCENVCVESIFAFWTVMTKVLILFLLQINAKIMGLFHSGLFSHIYSVRGFWKGHRLKDDQILRKWTLNSNLSVANGTLIVLKRMIIYCIHAYY